MNKVNDRKKYLTITPLLFLIILHVPAFIVDAIPELELHGLLGTLWDVFAVIIGVSMLIWGCIFYYIPTAVFLGVLITYTTVCWIWINKRNSIKFHIIWLLVCALLIIMYFKVGWIYRSMINN